MKYILATVVTTAGFAAHMRIIGRYFDREEMDGLFLTPCHHAVNGGATTHWISSGMFPKPFLRAMRNPPLMFTTIKSRFEERDEVMPYTQLQVTNRLNACTVVIAGDETPGVAASPFVEGDYLPETPYETLARVGLKLVSTPL